MSERGKKVVLDDYWVRWQMLPSIAHLNSLELFEHIRVFAQVQGVEPLSDVKMRPGRQRHLAARQGAQRREPEAPRDTCWEQTKTRIYFIYLFNDARINLDYVVSADPSDRLI
jgi:hypothetical protein